MRQAIASSLNRDQLAELVNLYHVARTALAGERDQSRWARMVWAAKHFASEHHGTSESRAYKELSRALECPEYG